MLPAAVVERQGDRLYSPFRLVQIRVKGHLSLSLLLLLAYAHILFRPGCCNSVRHGHKERHERGTSLHSSFCHSGLDTMTDRIGRTALGLRL